MTATVRPDDTSILLVDPILMRLDSCCFDICRNAVREKFEILGTAADLASVPRWFVISESAEAVEWLSKPCEKSRTRVFRFDASSLPWHQQDLKAAVKSEPRSRLVMCGFWLDTCLGATALEACVDGYDVHVITDLTFAHEPERAADVLFRLGQHGVVPLTLHQVIYELMTWVNNRQSSNELQMLLNHRVFRN